ncbi:hypothetical protein Ancab_031344 [Ancistrocladus abbreviatus]
MKLQLQRQRQHKLNMWSEWDVIFQATVTSHPDQPLLLVIPNYTLQAQSAEIVSPIKLHLSSHFHGLRAIIFFRSCFYHCCKKPAMATDALLRSRRRRNICLITLAFLIAIALILVILGVTVFRPRRPITIVNSVSVQDVDFSLGLLPSLRVYINVTLLAGISVKNPNKVGMKYTNSSAFLDYRGVEVGEAPIAAGRISAGQTLRMNITLTVLADRLISNSELYSDLMNGTLPLSTRTRISGKVSVLMFKIHVVSSTNCNLIISVSDRKITSQSCTYKTKL